MLTENEIIDKLETYFLHQNCEVKKLTTKQKGVDMIIKHSTTKLTYIEVKGETSANEKSKRYGQPFSGNQIWTHVSVALMKTLVDMSKPENENIKFAMAFPNNHEPMVERIRDAVIKLGIDVYFVSEKEIRVFQ